MYWLAYLALCYLAFCAIGWGVAFKFCANEADYRFLAPYLEAHPIRMRFVLVLTAVIVGPLFPLFLVHGAWECWRESHEWQRFRRTYRPVEFEATHPANVPAE